MNTSRAFSRRLKTIVSTAALAFTLGAPSVHAQSVATGLLNLSRAPLFLNQSVDPNIIFTFDDSGSMMLAYVPNELDVDSAVPTSINFPSATNINTSCWWRDRPWNFSSQVNSIYYDPNVVYRPPLRADGTSFPNSSFGSAWIDGIDANTSGRNIRVQNLGNDYVIQWGASFNGPQLIAHTSGTVTGCSPGTTTLSNNDTGLNKWERYFTDTRLNQGTGIRIGRRAFPFGNSAFYYRFTGDPDDPVSVYTVANYTAVEVSTQSAQQQQNFANWFSYYRNRYFLARTALTRAFDSVGSDIRLVWQGMSNTQLSNTRVIAPIGKGETQRDNFYDYLLNIARARHGTPTRAATLRAGNYIGVNNNSANTTNPYWDPLLGRELSCRQNFHLVVTDGGWKDAAGIIGNFDNQAFTLPDGREYKPKTQHTMVYSNEEDGNVSGWADNAFYYWSRDARPDLEDNVPAFIPDVTTGVTGPPQAPGSNPLEVPEIYWNPANDPATWQHLVQYVVAFGISGTVGFPDALDDLRRGSVSWPYWVQDTPYDGVEKVDDTWHGTLNSRGELFDAASPDQLVRALNNVFESITQRRSSITPVTVTGSVLSSTQLAFRTSFDTADWSGSVTALRPTPTGDAFVVEWRAEDELLNIDPARRIIFTALNSTGSSAAPFRWASLTNEQRAELRINPSTGTTDEVAVGQNRVDYIRGERGNERSNGGSFRDRNKILGSVVFSSAVFVPTGRRELYDDVIRSFEPDAAESGTYKDYDGPKRKQLLVGANDGMLHSFDPETGAERWAYVPFATYPNLSRLTSDELNFQSYVDGTPEVRDVFIRGEWRTVMVGIMRLGGQAVFALDITDGGVGSEAAHAGMLLWEFDDERVQGEELGYTYGQPFITRLANRKWVALVPGAYNSDEPDAATGTGQAVLFVIDIETGSLIRRFDLGDGTRGLGSVIAGDYRTSCGGHICQTVKASGDDVLDVSDVAFAGDLSGNLWRFNLESENPANWQPELFLIAERDERQPITAQPWIASTNDGRAVVIVGTGRYLDQNDRTRSIPVQSQYGIFDQGPRSSEYPIRRSRLLEQEVSNISPTRRTATVNELLPLQHRGWVFDLPEAGERVTVRATVRQSAGIGIVPTLIPGSDDPCSGVVASFLQFFDVTNGGIPGSSIDPNRLRVSFDTNDDGQISDRDDALQTGYRTESFSLGVTPVTLPGGGAAQLLIPGTGGPDSVATLTIPEFEWRRRTWRELFLE